MKFVQLPNSTVCNLIKICITVFYCYILDEVAGYNGFIIYFLYKK